MIKASSLDSLTMLEAINSWKTNKFTVGNMSIISYKPKNIKYNSVFVNLK